VTCQLRDTHPIPIETPVVPWTTTPLGTETKTIMKPKPYQVMWLRPGDVVTGRIAVLRVDGGEVEVIAEVDPMAAAKPLAEVVRNVMAARAKQMQRHAGES